MQPGGDGRLAAEGMSGPEGGDQGVLNRVGRFLAVSQSSQCHGPKPVAVAPYEFTEGVRFTGYVTSEEV
jgi:hypothetical protein